MWRIFLRPIEARARAMTQRIAMSTLSILIATVLLVIALLALSAALFLWLTPVLGAIESALLVAAAALVLAAIALLPVFLKRRPMPQPAAQPASQAGVDIATLLPLVTSILKLRPLLLGALLVALFATLTSKPTDSGENPDG
jgi:uncharacterized membrane protein YedE/YeeE